MEGSKVPFSLAPYADTNGWAKQCKAELCVFSFARETCQDVFWIVPRSVGLLAHV